MISKTPLENWIKAKVTPDNSAALSRARLEQYQLYRLREIIGRVKAESRFYRQLLAGVIPERIRSLQDLRFIPMTTVDDLKHHANLFSCVSQNEIKRVMTVATSGTTGEPKRLFFTEEDQEKTIDFFHYGMSVFTRPGDSVLILLPGERPGSVGDLLQKALARLGAKAWIHGPIVEPVKTLEMINHEEITVIVGIPTQVLRLVRSQTSSMAQLYHQTQNNRVREVLLTTDYVPMAIIKEVQQRWNCRVFNHYGMTEMGLGGGVQCEALGGYHWREADFIWEIIDIRSGEPLPEGEYGELVFTSLTAKGMPFIRYRTGDISRLIPEPCPCGTILKSMEPIAKRTNGKLKFKGGQVCWLCEFDEILFALPFVLDFNVAVRSNNGNEYLDIKVHLITKDAQQQLITIHDALDEIPAVKSAIANEGLKIVVDVATETLSRGTAKRNIEDLRGEKWI